MFSWGGEKKKNAVLNFFLVMQQNGAETIIQMKAPPEVAARPRHSSSQITVHTQLGPAVSERISLGRFQDGLWNFWKMRYIELQGDMFLKPANFFYQHEELCFSVLKTLKKAQHNNRNCQLRATI